LQAAFNCYNNFWGKHPPAKTSLYARMARSQDKVAHL